MKSLSRFLLATLVLSLVILACGSESGVEVVSPTDESSVESVEEVSAPEPISEQESPTLTSEPTKKAGTARSNPAPVGSEVIADEMSFVILGVTCPADEIVKAGNMFNIEPDEGYEYIFVELQITCLKSSDDKCSIGSYQFKLVGNSGVSYDAEWFISGVDGLLDLSTDFYGDAVVSGVIPFIVEESDELIFVYEPIWGDTFYLQVP